MDYVLLKLIKIYFTEKYPHNFDNVNVDYISLLRHIYFNFMLRNNIKFNMYVIILKDYFKNEKKIIFVHNQKHRGKITLSVVFSLK